MHESEDRILVVVGDPAVRRIVGRCLRGGRNRIIEADSGVSALTIFRRMPIDVTICGEIDDVDGLELFRHLRQFFPRTARIVPTARRTPNAHELAGASRFHGRQWRHEELRALVGSILRGRQVRYTKGPASAPPADLLHQQASAMPAGRNESLASLRPRTNASWACSEIELAGDYHVHLAAEGHSDER